MDFRSDQFSLGAILYEMTTGKRAFRRNTAVETLSAIIRDEPPPIASFNPGVPAELGASPSAAWPRKPRTGTPRRGISPETCGTPVTIGPRRRCRRTGRSLQASGDGRSCCLERRSWPWRSREAGLFSRAALGVIRHLEICNPPLLFSPSRPLAARRRTSTSPTA